MLKWDVDKLQNQISNIIAQDEAVMYVCKQKSLSCRHKKLVVVFNVFVMMVFEDFYKVE